jgi:SAM-dependent methyltransferase
MSLYSRFASAYERVFPFREGTHRFLRAHLPPPPTRVLDAGCGPGRYCGRLAAEGYEAVGVDLDPAMVEAARRDHPGAVFSMGDLADPAAIPGDLGGAFCIGNVISHLSADSRLQLAEILLGRVRPGGVWIVQTVNWDRILRDGGCAFPPLAASDDESTVLEREYADLTEGTVRFVTRLRSDDEVAFEEETVLHPMSRDRAVADQEAAGWRLVGAFGDFEGRPHDPASSPATVLVFGR